MSSRNKGKKPAAKTASAEKPKVDTGGVDVEAAKAEMAKLEEKLANLKAAVATTEEVVAPQEGSKGKLPAKPRPLPIPSKETVAASAAEDKEMLGDPNLFKRSFDEDSASYKKSFDEKPAEHTATRSTVPPIDIPPVKRKVEYHAPKFPLKMLASIAVSLVLITLLAAGLIHWMGSDDQEVVSEKSEISATLPSPENIAEQEAEYEKAQPDSEVAEETEKLTTAEKAEFAKLQTEIAVTEAELNAAEKAELARIQAEISALEAEQNQPTLTPAEMAELVRINAEISRMSSN